MEIYTLNLRPGVTVTEQMLQEGFKGCQCNGRTAEVVDDPGAPRTLPAAPADNPTTPGRVALGRRLFEDSRLSADKTMACSKCHQAQHAFTDGQATTTGLGGQDIPRNVPTLVNVGYRRSLFWDGRADNLEEILLRALDHSAVFDMSPEQFVARLRSIPEYAESFRQEFGHPPNVRAAAQALAAYQRSLLSHDTPFDRFADGDKSALIASAQRGYLIFRDKANCVTCHTGRDLTNGAFWRLGVGWDGKKYKDLGRFNITGKPRGAGKSTVPMPRGAGKFRVPTLRELRWTAPYMHDGSLKTLKEVVDLYADGGVKGSPNDLKDFKGPRKLTDADKKDLVAFLESLSSEQPVEVAGRRQEQVGAE